MDLTIHVDGAARGNPGPAGAGLVIHDQEQHLIFEAGYFLGRMTNNQAEYRSLLLGLEAARRCGGQQIAIFCDSELVVRQLTGQYRVKSPELRALLEQVQRRLLGFEGWQIRHVPRQENRRADELANRALEACADVIEPRFADLGRAGSDERPAGADVIVARCTRSARAESCPARCREGQSFEFTEVIPAGLCIHAASAILEAILALREKNDQPACSLPQTVRCARPNCGATFVLTCRAGSAR